LPKLFKFGNYYVYFWSNEQNEPVHVHVSKGRAAMNATKIWLTKSGGIVIEHNKSRIPQDDLKQISDAILVNYFRICSEWKERFGILDFYC